MSWTIAGSTFENGTSIVCPICGETLGRVSPLGPEEDPKGCSMIGGYFDPVFRGCREHFEGRVISSEDAP